jgi:glycosyltransferase involved in cell wall biosynthesis
MKRKVSVCIITYNQEKTIAQAINSVLMQETLFEYELIIGDDFSTDNTPSILQSFRNSYPDRIRLILGDENIGATSNLGRVLLASKGQYIALLEGDDYWTSPHKLQKQVNFLDMNPSYSTCYHAAQLVDRFGTPRVILPLKENKKETSTIIDLIKKDSFMATCTIMFVNSSFDTMPDVFYSSAMIADWPLNILNAERGLIGYIDAVMAVYRSNSSDMAFTSKRTSIIMQEAIKINKAFDAYLDYIYNDIFTRKIAGYYLTMATDYLSNGQVREFFYALRQSMGHKVLLIRTIKTVLVTVTIACTGSFFRINNPGLYKYVKRIISLFNIRLS